MIAAITACENLAQDFSWVPSLLEWFAEVSPLLVFLFAVYVFFKQRRDDRNHQLAIEKRMVFSRVISLLDDAWRDVESRHWSKSAPFTSLTGAENELKVLGIASDTERHLKWAKDAIKNRGSTDWTGILDPNEAGGLFLEAKGEYDESEINHWPTSRSVYEHAVKKLVAAMNLEVGQKLPSLWSSAIGLLRTN